MTEVVTKKMAHHHHLDHGLVDQTIDTSIVDIRAKKNEEKYQEKLNELVDGDNSKPEPLAIASNVGMKEMKEIKEMEVIN